MRLFLLFVTVPLIEIALFIQVGGVLGLWPTLALVIVTALAGTALVRQQGIAALGDVQRSLQGEGDPAASLAHGAFILVSGLLLLTPGFFTDGVGFALLIPGVRRRLIAALKDRLVVHAAQTRRGPQTVDGDYSVEPEAEQNPDAPASGRSGWTKPPAN